MLRLEDLDSSTRNIVRDAELILKNNKVILAEHQLNVGIIEEFIELFSQATSDEFKELKKVYLSIKENTVEDLKKDCIN